MSPLSNRDASRSPRLITALITSLAVLVAAAATATNALTPESILHLDASDAQLAGAFMSVEDPEAPGGVFVHVEKRWGSSREFDASDGAVFCFTIVDAGEYAFSVDVMGPNNGSNSFFVRVDYFDPWVWEFPMSKEFLTEPVKDHNGDQITTYLDSGQHVVGFFLHKSGARLAGVNIHGKAGVSNPQPCDGSDPELGDNQGQTTTTAEPAPTTSDDSRTSTTVATTTSTNEASTTSTSETATTSTSAGSTTSTTAATTTTTSAATTTTSGGGQFDVVIAPTDDVNSILRSHPEGTSFLLKAGTYPGLTLRPKSGQSITGEAGTVLDGQGRTPHAIGGEATANDVTLRKLKIINYTEYGIAWGAQGSGRGWVIVDCEIAHNHAGVALKDGAQVRNSHIHHNTTHGVWGNGRVLLEGNEIAYNHSQGHPSRAAGGILLGRSVNSVVRNNHIHHNYSFGLHFDGHNENILIEGNLVEDNHNTGILYELGRLATIRNNVARRNGAATSGRGGDGAGIMVIGATDVTVEGNRVEGNVNGIVGRQPNRTNADGKLWELKNLRVVNNTVKMHSGWTGIYDRAPGEPSLNANNVFSGNSYSLDSSSAQRFRWGPDMMTLSQWKGIHPNDG